MKQIFSAQILKNTPLSREIYEMELDLGRMGKTIRPGQFLHVRIGSGVDPLLRRPFSVYRVAASRSKTTIHVLYRVVGKGTNILAHTKRGESLDVLGPLGHGFDEASAKKSARVILVAGGMGIAPLVFLAQNLRSGSEQARRPDITAYVGADSAANVMAVPLLKKIGCRVAIATDDGSAGYHGYVTDLLRCDVPQLRADTPPHIAACGPLAMLFALQDICRREKWTGQVSVDEMMGCGVGACLGCVIRTQDNDGAYQYKRICHDGPVFDIFALAPEEKS